MGEGNAQPTKQGMRDAHRCRCLFLSDTPPPKTHTFENGRQTENTQGQLETKQNKKKNEKSREKGERLKKVN